VISAESVKRRTDSWGVKEIALWVEGYWAASGISVGADNKAMIEGGRIERRNLF